MKKERLKKLIKILLYLLSSTTVIAIIAFYVIKSLLGDLDIFLPYAKEMAGFNNPKNYLILFQNNNELRPTGGFINSYGTLNLNKGKLALSFADSYSLTNVANLPKAPEPFNHLLNADPKFKGWYFRDSNFNVDFTEAVKDIEKLFKQQSNQKNTNFDGVIAVNFELLEDLVSIYDLKLGDILLTKENLFSTLEFNVKNIDTHNVEDLKNRKNGMGELANTLMHEIIFSPTKYPALLKVIKTDLDQKKLILYFKNTALQQAIEAKGWADRFTPEKYKNFIYTNIANIGGRKSDRYITKQHEYFVSFDENNRGKVRYTLSMEHFGNYNLNSDIYTAYIRIFIPKNSTPSKQYFDSYLTLKPSEKKEITLEYVLPKSITPENFNLDLIKQPGTKDHWNLIVKTPAENSLKSSEFEVKEGLSTWSNFLLSDQHFTFQLLKDTIPPVIVWQKFSDQNLIEVNISEPLNEGSLLNPNNYKVTDLNYIDNNTDQINIEKVYFKNNSIFIQTNGISYVKGERYSLKIKNLEDLAGNNTVPSTLNVTVVQSS